jgi:hypothetical protein
MPLQGKIAVGNFYGYSLFTVFLWFKAAKIIQFKGISWRVEKPESGGDCDNIAFDAFTNSAHTRLVDEVNK